MKTVYDAIREGTFTFTSWMREANALLQQNSAVVAWWCRQSGKSAFAIKIAHDTAIKQMSDIVFVCAYHNQMKHVKDHLLRTFKSTEILNQVGDQIFLVNGSRIAMCSSNSRSIFLNNADLVIFDEFEFMEKNNFLRHLGCLRNRKPLTRWEKIKCFFGFHFPVPVQKLIFTSSMKDGSNFGALLGKMKNLPISRANGRRVSSKHSEEMKMYLDSDTWKKEYDSYEEE
jgi:hypothetical protein